MEARGATNKARRSARGDQQGTSQRGAAAERNAHRGCSARRTSILVTEPTSHELSRWLKVAASLNMLCSHAARGFGSVGARGAA